MAEMANVPAEWFAIFHRANLPGHPDNPDTDAVIEWPEIDGEKVMPMSGRFLVRHVDGSLTAHEDGFLVIGHEGHPHWKPRPS